MVVRVGAVSIVGAVTKGAVAVGAITVVAIYVGASNVLQSAFSCCG